MKRIALSVAGLLVLAATAVAGDACLAGSDCANACPLAKTANERLATGHEAMTVSKEVREEFVRTILANMEAI